MMNLLKIMIYDMFQCLYLYSKAFLACEHVGILNQQRNLKIIQACQMKLKLYIHQKLTRLAHVYILF